MARPVLLSASRVSIWLSISDGLLLDNS